MTARAYDERALLAAIHDAPDDDAARAVYADFLQTKGDARGAFIALQLAQAAGGPGAAQAGIEATRLLRAHRRTWLVPFEGAVATKSAQFERGFLSSCRVRVERNADVRRLFGSSAWATVKRIQFGTVGRISFAMKALEEAQSVPDLGLEDLERAVFPRLRTLSVADGGLWSRRDPIASGEPHSKGMRALRDAKGLPALVELHLDFPSCRGPQDYCWLLESEIGMQLESFGVKVGFDDDASGLERTIRDWVGSLLERREGRRLRKVTLATAVGQLELCLRDATISAVVRVDRPRSGGWAAIDTTSLDAAFERCIADGLDVDWRGMG